jgi:head-tail adaptor
MATAGRRDTLVTLQRPTVANDHGTPTTVWQTACQAWAAVQITGSEERADGKQQRAVTLWKLELPHMPAVGIAPKWRARFSAYGQAHVVEITAATTDGRDATLEGTESL